MMKTIEAYIWIGGRKSRHSIHNGPLDQRIDVILRYDAMVSSLRSLGVRCSAEYIER